MHTFDLFYYLIAIVVTVLALADFSVSGLLVVVFMLALKATDLENMFLWLGLLICIAMWMDR